jgi:hypothetical protein
LTISTKYGLSGSECLLFGQELDETSGYCERFCDYRFNTLGLHTFKSDEVIDIPLASLEKFIAGSGRFTHEEDDSEQ